MNHEGFQHRLDLVRSVLADSGLEASDISPIGYEEDCPFPYNNFIYKISLQSPATGKNFADAGPLAAQPPAEGVSTLVIRLSNPAAEGLVQANRVENEVAAIHLAREGLRAFKPELQHAVPAVYAWKAGKHAKDGLGWILMEFKPGEQLDAHFDALSGDKKKHILEQIADVFAGIQRAPVPETVVSHGGLTVDERARIVSGQMTTLHGGPWSTYRDFWHTRLTDQLQGAEDGPVLQGWRPNGVRQRIDKFLESGIEQIISSTGEVERVLIHGDLTTNNILFDPDTNTITGLVDFDFASVSHPAQEFFTSFGDIGGNTGGGHGPDPSQGRLPKAVLTGDFDAAAHDLPEAAKDTWDVARAWDAALAARGATRPSDIKGIETLDQLRKLEGQLCPFRLVHPVFVKQKTPEQLAEERRLAEEALISTLEALGY